MFAKIEVIPHFMQLKNLIETQFHTCIKILCINGGCEYANDQFQNLLHSYGIIHQTIYPYALKQTLPHS